MNDDSKIILPGGSNIWYHNGKKHREDGPAVEWYFGDKEWWLWGNRIRSYKDFQEYAKCSDGYIMYLKLKYGEIQ